MRIIKIMDHNCTLHDLLFLINYANLGLFRLHLMKVYKSSINTVIPEEGTKKAGRKKKRPRKTKVK